MERLTFAKLKQRVREDAPSCSVRKRDGEYRVAYYAGSDASREASAYYTNDPVDAYDTACYMHRHA